MYSSGDSLCIIMLVSKTMKSEKRRAPPAAIILSIRTVGKKICWNRIYLFNGKKSIFKCNVPLRKITLCIQSKMKKNKTKQNKWEKNIVKQIIFNAVNFFYKFVGNLIVLDLYFKVQCSSKKDNSFQMLMFREKKIITDMVK